MKNFFVVGLLCLSAFATGCAAQTSDSGENTDVTEGDVSVSTLAGTYVNPTTENDDLSFYEITFNADHTYTAQGGCRQDGPGIHCHAISLSEGTWAMKRSGPQLGAPGGGQQLALTDQFGQTNRYFYTLQSGTLSLSVTYHGTASVFEKQVAAPSVPVPDGTYTDNGADTLPFYTVTFNSDNSFTAHGGCRPTKGIHCHAVSLITGTWSTVTSGPQLGAPQGVPEIVLVDQFDQTTKYFYELSGANLSLSTTYRGTPSVFVHE